MSNDHDRPETGSDADPGWYAWLLRDIADRLGSGSPHFLDGDSAHRLRSLAALLDGLRPFAEWLDLPPTDGLYWLRFGDDDPEPVCVTLVARDAEEDPQDLYVRRLGVGGVVYLDALRRCAGGRPLRWRMMEGS